jgi:hypothetical protein
MLVFPVDEPLGSTDQQDYANGTQWHHNDDHCQAKDQNRQPMPMPMQDVHRSSWIIRKFRIYTATG